MSNQVWEPEPWMQLDPMPRIKAVDTEHFERDIIRARQPVLVEGWLDGWPALEKWSQDYLIDRCGENEITIRALGKEGDKFRSWKRGTTVGEWLEELKHGQKDDLYLAEAALGETLPEVVEDIGEVPYGNRDGSRLQLMMGRTTYAPFHFHARHDAVAVQAVGKSFVLYGPTESRHLYPQPWYAADYWFGNVDLKDPTKVDTARFPQFREARGYHCTMSAGEALFIPMHWWHAVHGGHDFNVLLTDFYFSEATNRWNYPFPGFRMWAQKVGLAGMRRSIKRGTVFSDVARALRGTRGNGS